MRTRNVPECNSSLLLKNTGVRLAHPGLTPVVVSSPLLKQTHSTPPRGAGVFIMREPMLIQSGGRAFGNWCKRKSLYLARVVVNPAGDHSAGMQIDLGMVLRDDERNYVRVATCINSRKGDFGVYKIHRDRLAEFTRLS